MLPVVSESSAVILSVSTVVSTHANACSATSTVGVYPVVSTVVSTHANACSATSTISSISIVLYILVMQLCDVVALLAYAVVLSSYERRIMSLMHSRDAPVA